MQTQSCYQPCSQRALQKYCREKPSRCGLVTTLTTTKHTCHSVNTVYTVGLYVNHASAKPLLRKHKGSNESTFIKNQQAYNGVLPLLATLHCLLHSLW